MITNSRGREQILYFLNRPDIQEYLKENNFAAINVESNKEWQFRYPSHSLFNFIYDDLGVDFCNYLRVLTPYSFMGEYKNTAVEIPKNVKTIRSNAFYNTNLTKIVIDDAKEIYPNAFYENAYLEEVIFKGNSLKKFTTASIFTKGCPKLVYIPESVTAITSSAFGDNNDEKFVIVTPRRGESNRLTYPRADADFMVAHLRYLKGSVAPAPVAPKEDSEEIE